MPGNNNSGTQSNAEQHVSFNSIFNRIDSISAKLKGTPSTPDNQAELQQTDKNLRGVSGILNDMQMLCGENTKILPPVKEINAKPLITFEQLKQTYFASVRGFSPLGYFRFWIYNGNIEAAKQDLQQRADSNANGASAQTLKAFGLRK